MHESEGKPTRWQFILNIQTFYSADIEIYVTLCIQHTTDYMYYLAHKRRELKYIQHCSVVNKEMERDKIWNNNINNNDNVNVCIEWNGIKN
jgi:hypothetical protein